MIDKLCAYLTKKIKENVPDIDDERAEVINYGLQNIIGEFPKIIIALATGVLLGVGNLTVLNFLFLLLYRAFAGGFHAKTHVGCILSTVFVFCAPAIIAKFFVMDDIVKYIVVALIWIFGMIMIRLYAPADTENVPILRKKERRQKQILAYIVLTIELGIAMFINNPVISNMIIISVFIETLTITKLAYKITNNKYGYEVYGES